MDFFNSHTHTCYSHDATGTIEENCKKALTENLFGFAVTDHCDCEYATDISIQNKLSQSFSEAKKMQALYKGRLIISCGVEIGEALYEPLFSKKIIASHSWDVILGSVHAVRLKNLDMPFSTINFSEFSDELIDRFISQYFTDVYEMLISQDFDVLSHLTVVLRYIVNKYKRQVDIKKYYPVITKILQQTINLGKCLEINTSGFSDGLIMPDKNIIKIYKELGGHKITLGSDSHSPEMLSNGLEGTAAILKNIGFDTFTYYINRQACSYKIQ